MTKNEVVKAVYDLLTFYGNPAGTTMCIAQDPYRGDLYRIFIEAAKSGCTKYESSNFLSADSLVDSLIALGIPPNAPNLKLVHKYWDAWSYYYNCQNP